MSVRERREVLGWARVFLAATPRWAGGHLGHDPSSTAVKVRQTVPAAVPRLLSAPRSAGTAVSEGEQETGAGVQVAAPAALPSSGALWGGRKPQRGGVSYAVILSEEEAVYFSGNPTLAREGGWIICAVTTF